MWFEVRQFHVDPFIVEYMTRAAQTITGAARAREYGRGGLFGVLTPQANPVAEPELRILLPPESALLAARLRSSNPMLRGRLTDYGEHLGEFVESFGTIAFDAVGVACTGCSYWLDPGHERQRTEAIAVRRGYPIVTAAEAVEAALDALGVRSLALVSPYPAWLTDVCRAHWERRGLRVTATLQLGSEAGEAHRIYELTTRAVLAALDSFEARGAQCILLTGTGMPSLRVILAQEPLRGVPVLSSNLCLAWALARITGEAGPGAESRLFGGWAARLAMS
jgi:maleate isomerase